MDYKKYIRAGKTASDITPLFADITAFHSLIEDLYKRFENLQVDKIACIEARGFILDGALANKMKIGLIPIRKSGLQNEAYKEKFIDYSGKEKELIIHKDAIKQGGKVLLIDDWVETGEAIKAAIRLIEKCEGVIVGVGIFMDDSSDQTKAYLSKYNYQYIEKVLPEDKF